jgi:hypothetical protein
MLTRAIKKAIASGYVLPSPIVFNEEEYRYVYEEEDGDQVPLIDDYDDYEVIDHLAMYRIVIFSPEFAKAFWGQESINYYVEDFNMGKPVPKGVVVYEGERVFITLDDYHRQEMVISDDPIKYLRRFLDLKD